MLAENNAITIIPSECFRWRARVQFMETFRTRQAALNFAFQNGCNLIVERNEGRSPIYDVLRDPDGACTSGLDLELLKTEDVLVEPPEPAWITLMLSGVWDFGRRLAALLASLYAREIVPLSRRVVAVARLCYFRDIAPLSRRVAAAARTCYFREIVPFSCRTAAVACTYLREIAPLSRRAAATARVYYLQKIIPISRRAAGVARTYFFREIVPISRRSVAFARLYVREIVPILRTAAARCWSDSKSISRRQSWAVATSHHSNPSRLR